MFAIHLKATPFGFQQQCMILVSNPPVNCGKKSKTYNIPPELWDGLPGVQGQIFIQAIFCCADWTLLFVDYNVMIFFYIMALQKPWRGHNFILGSIVST